MNGYNNNLNPLIFDTFSIQFNQKTIRKRHFFKTYSMIAFILSLLLLFFLIYWSFTKARLIKVEKIKISTLVTIYQESKVDNNDLKINLNKLNDDRYSFEKENNSLIKIIEKISLENEERLNRFLTQKEHLNTLSKKVSQKNDENDQFAAICHLNKEIQSLQSDISTAIAKRNELKNLLDKDRLQIDSKILEFNTQLNQIIEWLNINKKISFKLLYRKSEDGYSPNIFHKKCDRLRKTLILIKSDKGTIFGGYTVVEWDESGFQFDQEAFLFNLSLGKKYSINSPKFAMYAGQEYLFVFGFNDLVAHENYIYSKFPTSYGRDSSAFELTGGQESIIAIEIEVYHIKSVK